MALEFDHIEFSGGISGFLFFGPVSDFLGSSKNNSSIMAKTKKAVGKKSKIITAMPSNNQENFLSGQIRKLSKKYFKMNLYFEQSLFDQLLIKQTEHHSSKITFASLLAMERGHETHISHELAFLFVYSWLDLLQREHDCNTERSVEAVARFIETNQIAGFLCPITFGYFFNVAFNHMTERIPMGHYNLDTSGRTEATADANYAGAGAGDSKLCLGLESSDKLRSSSLKINNEEENLSVFECSSSSNSDHTLRAAVVGSQPEAHSMSIEAEASRTGTGADDWADKAVWDIDESSLERALGNVLWGIDTTACVIANSAEDEGYSVEVREAREVEAREAGAKESKAVEAEARETEAREAEAREAKAKEAEAREAEAREA